MSQFVICEITATKSESGERRRESIKGEERREEEGMRGRRMGRQLLCQYGGWENRLEEKQGGEREGLEYVGVELESSSESLTRTCGPTATSLIPHLPNTSV